MIIKSADKPREHLKMKMMLVPRLIVPRKRSRKLKDRTISNSKMLLMTRTIQRDIKSRCLYLFSLMTILLEYF